MTTKEKKTGEIGHQVFIAYANERSGSPMSKDREVAERVYAELETQDILCWIAPGDILPGEDWLDKNIDAVIQTKLMILVFSSNTNESRWVNLEVRRALRENKIIIPFRIENVSPIKGLRALEDLSQWMDAFTLPLEKHIEQLVKVVCHHLGKEPKKFPKKTIEQPEVVKIKADIKEKEKKRNGAKKRIKELEKMPLDVIVVSKGVKVEINKKGLWEADYDDGIIMVYIPPDDFIMGSHDYDKEEPPHDVYLDGYWMGKTVVTVAQYMQFAKNTGSHYPEWLEKNNKYNIETREYNRYKKFGIALTGDNYPIIGVSFYDAIDYCKWLSEKTGVTFKLPTEAQWEKAARGKDGRKYPWGIQLPDYNGEYYAKYNKVKKFKYTAPVGSFPEGASPYGLLDMAGNVWEWCNDWYDEDYYKNSPDKNPMGPTSGTRSVMRGGSWSNNAVDIRCACRNFNAPSIRNEFVGFRLCMINK